MAQMKSKFKTNDKVRVINLNLLTYNSIGVVEGVNYWGDAVNVRLDGVSRTFTYNPKNLTLISEEEYNTNTKGDNKMIMGNYMVAMVKFVQGTNTTKEYAFALFDYSIVINDLVLCDTANGYNVARVVEIFPKSECKADVTKEIICNVDFEAYNIRKDNREKARQLKVEMEKKVKAMQELTLYEMMAEKSPELKEMLDNYKSLIG